MYRVLEATVAYATLICTFYYHYYYYYYWQTACRLLPSIFISTLRWAVLTVLWIGFCYTGPISLCIDSFVFIYVYFVCFFISLSLFIAYSDWSVAVPMTRRHSLQSFAFCQAVWTPKFIGLTSSAIIRRQVKLGLPGGSLPGQRWLLHRSPNSASMVFSGLPSCNVAKET